VARVIIKDPVGRSVHSRELVPNRELVIGRASLARSAGERAVDHGEFVPISDPSVSANHLRVRAEAEGVVVEDLNSRNGTWLALPRGEPLRVKADEVVVRLGFSASASAANEPPPAVWKGPDEYADALVNSIRSWPRLGALDLEVRVTRADPDGVTPNGIPLATGEVLELLPRATTDDTWSELLETLWRWIEGQNSTFAAEERTRHEGMILASPSIRCVHREVVDAAQREVQTLLLRGPSGAGKEMLAEVFHRHSGRQGPFVAVNCSMFSKDFLRSELFGAEVGSFTGATRRIVGAVERAQGGTLFLDEIGDMPCDVQPMLLRFLDRREFDQLGQYGRRQRADVRIVAATNKDLRTATRTGEFRADLWFRLCVHVVEVPPLSERWDDIIAYLETTPVVGASHSLREALTPEALDVLRDHPWEGNFRELASLRERVPRAARPNSVDAATCLRALERGSLSPPSPRAATKSGPVSQTDWAELATRATDAFSEDHSRVPSSWDDQKEWNEKYLKPLVFFHLSGAAAESPPADDDALTSLASRAAVRLKADRGTALKQLTRYYQRFRT
jgi:DNA-binding NtrC family response regulator